MNNWKKKFIIIWSGQLFSILSSSIAQFAIVLWISLETGSAEVLSFATIAALLPQVVLGPFAGVFVDRWSRKWTMILADSFRCTLFGHYCVIILSGRYRNLADLSAAYAPFCRKRFPRTCHEIIHTAACS